MLVYAKDSVILWLIIKFWTLMKPTHNILGLTIVNTASAISEQGQYKQKYGHSKDKMKSPDIHLYKGQFD